MPMLPMTIAKATPYHEPMLPTIIMDQKKTNSGEVESIGTLARTWVGGGGGTLIAFKGLKGGKNEGSKA